MVTQGDFAQAPARDRSHHPNMRPMDGRGRGGRAGQFLPNRERPDTASHRPRFPIIHLQFLWTTCASTEGRRSCPVNHARSLRPSHGLPLLHGVHATRAFRPSHSRPSPSPGLGQRRSHGVLGSQRSGKHNRRKRASGIRSHNQAGSRKGRCNNPRHRLSGIRRVRPVIRTVAVSFGSSLWSSVRPSPVNPRSWAKQYASLLKGALNEAAGFKCRLPVEPVQGAGRMAAPPVPGFPVSPIPCLVVMFLHYSRLHVESAANRATHRRGVP